MPEELDAIQRLYDLMSWTLDRIESFPKGYRVRLGDRMQDTMYGALDRLIDAKYARRGQKLDALSKANLLLERLRFQGRIASDKRCMSPKQHGYFSKLVNEAGTSVGGWMKQQRRTRAGTTVGVLALLGLGVGALVL